ncbi:flagellin N-terminal helical domain-containing protein [Lignipirellula cremea]|uniref:Flagellin n=1 Tax=Lignipirellula cremea TaxID=2528010 RepID=A0A518DR52_9BACT|nr:flagellin [Lignipirellula cremea]QDU94313.1 Flagellar hook-associated protein 3 [Lignipirellula cremea]
MTVIPVGVGRATELQVQRRLQNQLQLDQTGLLRTQEQLSTGRRVLLPSDDARAANRAVSLQRVLEQKIQVRSNITTTESYLSTTESSIATVSNLLAEIHGLAISSVDASTSDAQRQAAKEQTLQAISELTDIGNRKFRDRYLFAGSATTQQPFSEINGVTAFLGNEGLLKSFSDDDLLFDVNISAQEVFGALSEPDPITVDLDPVLTSNTRLADLRGGNGITLGLFTVSDGETTKTIDIRGAQRVNDVVRLIESNPPDGKQVTARLEDGHLVVELEGGGSLTIREVGNGITAAELGIVEKLGAVDNRVVGEDLDPRLNLTTSLKDVLGVRAKIVLQSEGYNNDLVLEAKQRGEEFNGYSLQIVDDELLNAGAGLSAGSEYATFSDTPVAAQASLSFNGAGNDLILTATNAGSAYNGVAINVSDAGLIGNTALASYDAATKTLTLGIDSSGATDAQALIDAIDAQGLFTAAYDGANPADGGFNPAASIPGTDAGVIRGDTGNSGGDANTIFVHVKAGQSSANQVRDALQANAEVAALFDVRVEGKDTLTAPNLGRGPVATITAQSTGGAGVEFDQESGLQIVNGGQQYTIDFSEARTIEDLLNKLNGSDAGVLAQIDPSGRGIQIRTRLSGNDFSIGENGGQTASQLGVRTLTAESALHDFNYGRGVSRTDGVDFTITRNDGVELEIDIGAAATVADVLDVINNHPDNQGPGAVLARLSEYGNGIELIDDNPAAGGVLTITKSLQSEAAWDLGLIPPDQDSVTADSTAVAASAQLAFSGSPLNTGIALTANTAGGGLSDVTIEFLTGGAGDTATAVYDEGTKRLQITIDPAATTANTIIDAINLEGSFLAQRDLSQNPGNNGTGVVGFTGDAGVTIGGSPDKLQSADTNPREVKGVFNSLRRLVAALDSGDNREIERAAAALEDDQTRVTFARSDLGARLNSLDSIKTRLDTEEINLRETLSIEIEVDFPTAVSELTAQQASYEASLQLMGRTFQLSLLDYI